MKLLSSSAFILLGYHQGLKPAFVAATPNHIITTNSFELLGRGYCTDSRYRFHSYVEGENVGPTPENCSAWCLQNPDKLLGFSYSSRDNGHCYCELDGGELPDFIYFNPSESESEIGSGIGPIVETSLVDDGDEFDCYVYPTIPFELVGRGYCTDSSQNFYSYVEGENVGPSPEDCSAWCLQNPSKLLGFTYRSSEDDSQCYCELDLDDYPDYVYINPSESESEYGPGTGPISGTSLDDNGGLFECYTYQTPSSPPLTGSDVGSVLIPGSSTVINNQIKVKGSGKDIWHSSDSFQFLHKTASGDSSIEIYVENLAGAGLHDWSKGGLMIRDSLAANSKHFSLFVTGGNGLANQWRPNGGSSSFSHHSTNTASRNLWLKITKTGNKLQAYYKTDNTDNWFTFGSERTMSFSNTFYYGIAVTSHDNTKIAELTGQCFLDGSPVPSSCPVENSLRPVSASPVENSRSPISSSPIENSRSPISASPVENSLSPVSASSVSASPSMRPVSTRTPTERPTGPSTTNNICYKSARKVRLESTTGKQLQMYELRVFSSSINVALNKHATQSSTLSTLGDTFAASNAVDGDSLTFSHTRDANAYFEVDLGDTFDLESVEIVNRWCQDETDPNRCLCRLSYANLKLIDEDDSIVASRMLGNTCNEAIILESFAACAYPPPFY